MWGANIKRLSVVFNLKNKIAIYKIVYVTVLLKNGAGISGALIGKQERVAPKYDWG